MVFSVIIPVFNRLEYLPQALNSVWQQSFTDFEIIVVDDGSTDGTSEYIQALGNRVRFLRQENKGPGAARNLGASHARGEHLAFLDSDDLWFPWTLESYARCIAEHEAVNVIAGRGVFFESVVPNGHGATPLRSQLYDSLFSAMRDEQVSLPTPAVAVRRKSFLEVGGFRSLFAAEDMDLWLRLGCLARFVRITNPPVCAERQHPDRTTHNLDLVLQGIRFVLREESIGCYPGGRRFAGIRKARLARASRSISGECVKRGRIRDGWELYRQTFGMNLQLGRWRYLAGFPFIATLMAAQTRHSARLV